MRKNKNKLYLILIMICILTFSLTAYAKNETVTISSAEATKTTVTVSGTTKALAVMVQVRDAEDNILKMESFGTVSGEFSGKIEDLTLKEGTEYTVYVADYEGGDWTTATVNVPESTTETTTTTEATTTTTEATTQATTEATTQATTETQKTDTTPAKQSAKSPTTGDSSPIVPMLLLLLGSVMGMIYLRSKKHI